MHVHVISEIHRKEEFNKLEEEQVYNSKEMHSRIHVFRLDARCFREVITR